MPVFVSMQWLSVASVHGVVFESIRKGGVNQSPKREVCVDSFKKYFSDGEYRNQYFRMMKKGRR